MREEWERKGWEARSNRLAESERRGKESSFDREEEGAG